MSFVPSHSQHHCQATTCKGVQCLISVPNDRWDCGARFCHVHRCLDEKASLDSAEAQIKDLEPRVREDKIAKNSLAPELEAERQKNAALERHVRTTTAALDEAREMSARLMTERDDAIAARDAADAEVATLSARLTAAADDDRLETMARLSVERDDAHAARGYATAQVDAMSAGIDEACEMLPRFGAGWR
ncbi:hypothetical protein BFW01_g1731 [Lasiodiplodia theobromae]|nr:hypothetical protein BFW01_g1731 [Lasiodiplodia theobromae]